MEKSPLAEMNAAQTTLKKIDTIQGELVYLIGLLLYPKHPVLSSPVHSECVIDKMHCNDSLWPSNSICQILLDGRSMIFGICQPTASINKKEKATHRLPSNSAPSMMALIITGSESCISPSSSS